MLLHMPHISKSIENASQGRKYLLFNELAAKINNNILNH